LATRTWKSISTRVLTRVCASATHHPWQANVTFLLVPGPASFSLAEAPFADLVDFVGEGGGNPGAEANEASGDWSEYRWRLALLADPSATARLTLDSRKSSRLYGPVLVRRDPA
jgi:hypothetical protein